MRNAECGMRQWVMAVALAIALLAGTAQAATTTSQELRLQAGERWRPRAEQCLGLIALAPEVYRRLAAVPCEGEGVIEDGQQGQAPFTRAHYRAMTQLWGTVASLGQSTQTMAALHAMQVRSIGVITPELPEVQPGLGDLESNLRYIIRPLAPRVRALRRMIEDDSRITPRVLGGLADSDLIDDGRSAEHLAPIPVGAVRLMQTTLEALTGPGVNTDDVADATDAACTGPLKAE
jgi:hypothetical protein